MNGPLTMYGYERDIKRYLGVNWPLTIIGI